MTAELPAIRPLFQAERKEEGKAYILLIRGDFPEVPDNAFIGQNLTTWSTP